MLDSQPAIQPEASAPQANSVPASQSFPRTTSDFDILDDGDDAPSADQPPRRPWYRRPAPLIAIVAVVVIVALVSAPLILRAVRGPRAQHQTASVTRGAITLSVGASGNVAAPTYDVAFGRQGTIASIAVSVGQQVSAGATLATLTYTLPDGSSQTQTLTAPHSGTVASVNGVVDGSPITGQTFIEIDDLTATFLVVNVNESDIASVAVGQAVQFSVSAYPNISAIDGTVTSISPSGQSASNVVSFPVTVAINRATLQGANLFPGMSVNATLIQTQRANVLLIPTSAVSYAHSEASGGAVSAMDVTNALNQANQMVSAIKKAGGTPASDNPTANYVLELSGTPGPLGRTRQQLVVVPVVLGLTDGTNYEVLGGLAQGDSVVVG